MAVKPLEERVETLEDEVSQLKEKLNSRAPETKTPWWEQIFGTFKDCPEYDEAMREGREYRESLRPKD